MRPSSAMRTMSFLNLDKHDPPGRSFRLNGWLAWLTEIVSNSYGSRKGAREKQWR
jgi:hypothetical protein